MQKSSTEPMTAHSPLEEFVRDYVETIGGAWEEVEPQVYDVLIPSEGAESKLDAGEQEILRITFDPEALPDHPGAQLASYGTPLIDRLLANGVRRGRFAKFYFVGLNLAPHDLASRIQRTLRLVAQAFQPVDKLRLEKVRTLNFAQVVFWFEATFVSDQKEQEILPVALDLHYLRQVRHLEKLLDLSRLAEQPGQIRPEVRRASLAEAYPIAREEVVRRLAALANTRGRDLRERLERQVARMTRYYRDLRSELDDQARRGRSGDEGRARVAARREAVDREERLRVAELRQKNTLRVNLRLLNLAVIQQPKLLVRCLLVSSQGKTGNLEMVWDPLIEALEAAPCPDCQRPTFAFGLTRQGRVVCSECVGKAVK